MPLIKNLRIWRRICHLSDKLNRDKSVKTLEVPSSLVLGITSKWVLICLVNFLWSHVNLTVNRFIISNHNKSCHVQSLPETFDRSLSKYSSTPNFEVWNDCTWSGLSVFFLGPLHWLLCNWVTALKIMFYAASPTDCLSGHAYPNRWTGALYKY